MNVTSSYVKGQFIKQSVSVYCHNNHSRIIDNTMWDRMSCYTRLPAVHHQSRSSSTLVTATSSPLASRLLASSRSLSISPSISQLVGKRQTRTVLSPNSAEKFLQIKAAAPATEARAAAAHQTWISDSSRSTVAAPRLIFFASHYISPRDFTEFTQRRLRFGVLRASAAPLIDPGSAGGD